MYIQNVVGDFGNVREFTCSFKYSAQNGYLGNNAIHWCYFFWLILYGGFFHARVHYFYC